MRAKSGVHSPQRSFTSRFCTSPSTYMDSFKLAESSRTLLDRAGSCSFMSWWESRETHSQRSCVRSSPAKRAGLPIPAAVRPYSSASLASSPSSLSARTRVGDYIFSRVLILLAINGLLGLAIPGIDNLAHLGEALAGVGVGLIHGLPKQSPGRRTNVVLGTLAMVAFACAFGAQALRARSIFRQLRPINELNKQIQVLDERITYLIFLRTTYGQSEQLSQNEPKIVVRIPWGGIVFDWTTPAPDEAARKHLNQRILGTLRGMNDRFTHMPTDWDQDAYRRLRVLAARSLFKPPTPEEASEFEAAFKKLVEPMIVLAEEKKTKQKADLEKLGLPKPPKWFRQRPQGKADAAEPKPERKP